MAWGVMLGVEFLSSPVLSRIPTLNNSRSPIAQLVEIIASAAWIYGEPAWTVPAAVMVLLVPFYLVSWAIEYLILNQMLSMPEDNPSGLSSHRIRLAVRDANLATYGLMFAATTAWLLLALPLR